jgi:uncharacterized protein YdcH (DUF465 family)
MIRKSRSKRKLKNPNHEFKLLEEHNSVDDFYEEVKQPISPMNMVPLDEDDMSVFISKT